MNILLQKELDKIDTLLDITEYQMYQLRDTFFEDMENKTMLKMIPTFSYCNVDVPNGEYLAVDFGGTNVRCYKYEVKSKEIKIKENVCPKKYSLSLSIIVSNLSTIKFKISSKVCSLFV